MKVVKSLKDKLTPEVVFKLADFLGESSEAVQNTFDKSIGLFQNGLIDIVRKEGSVKNLIKVIQDGGHSGDLLENLGNLFSMPDKVRLLNTIGENINNHFFKAKRKVFVDYLAGYKTLSHNSASILMNITAPLVLGVLGRDIRQNSWEASEFMSNLLNHHDTEQKDLPHIPEHLENKPAEFLSHKQIEQKNTGKRDDTGSVWLAWILLGILGLVAVFYYFRSNSTKRLSESAVTVDSLQTSGPQDIFEALDTASIGINQKETPVTDSVPPKPEDFLPQNTSTPKLPEKTAQPVEKKHIPVVGPKPKLKPTPQQKRTLTVKPASVPTPVSPVRSSSSQPMSQKLKRSDRFFGINSLTFKANSAEIISDGEINQLVHYLNINISEQIEICAPGNSPRIAIDRAYALRDILYYKGIPASRINICSDPIKGYEPVMVRMK